MILKCSVLFLLILDLSCEGAKYKGESFPLKYLRPDDQHPVYSDVEDYLQALNKMIGYFSKYANETDINRALGTFYMNAILTKTVKENENKIQEEQLKLMKCVVRQGEDVLSHFFSHVINPLQWSDVLKRAGSLLRHVDLQVEAIGEFKRNRLHDWILSNVTFNDFEKDMDELKLPKEFYLQLTEKVIDSEKNMNYSINIDDSDYCLGEVIYNPTPPSPNTQALNPCVYDQFCSRVIYKRAPSISYSLSHRMLNIMMVHHIRRCYLLSAEDDAAMMEAMCSSMYREAVYIARRGYFNRDMWMEHIALCGLFGYEEFFRRHWFRKVISWIDKQGCVAENFNYEANRTRYLLSAESEPAIQQKIRNISQKVLSSRCHWHPMALTLVVLAHGVRHAVHFSEDNIRDEL